MPDIRVIGVDPGPIPGVVVLDVLTAAGVRPWLGTVEVFQCSANAVRRLVHDKVRDTELGARIFLQVERFVERGRANADQRLTREMANALLDDVEALVRTTGFQRPAVQVKPWATDARLEVAGLLEICKGMRHARDAARHALFAACHDAGLPDPLSKDWRSSL